MHTLSFMKKYTFWDTKVKLIRFVDSLDIKGDSRKMFIMQLCVQNPLSFKLIRKFIPDKSRAESFLNLMSIKQIIKYDSDNIYLHKDFIKKHEIYFEEVEENGRY